MHKVWIEQPTAVAGSHEAAQQHRAESSADPDRSQQGRETGRSDTEPSFGKDDEQTAGGACGHRCQNLDDRETAQQWIESHGVEAPKSPAPATHLAGGSCSASAQPDEQECRNQERDGKSDPDATRRNGDPGNRGDGDLGDDSRRPQCAVGDDQVVLADDVR